MMLEIDENIYPCKGCKDYNPLDRERGCRSNGGCGKPYTNADRIRSMTDEELAELLTAVAKKSADKLCESLKTVDVDLSNCDFGILYKAHLSWLKQSAKEGET